MKDYPSLSVSILRNSVENHDPEVLNI